MIPFDLNQHGVFAASGRISQQSLADRLGVTREHLNRVLNGHRISRRLTERYRALRRELEEASNSFPSNNHTHANTQPKPNPQLR